MDASPAKLNKLKVAELRDELAKRGLPTDGTKPVLVERLSAALNEGAHQAEPAAPVAVEPQLQHAEQPATITEPKETVTAVSDAHTVCPVAVDAAAAATGTSTHTTDRAVQPATDQPNEAQKRPREDEDKTKEQPSAAPSAVPVTSVPVTASATDEDPSPKKLKTDDSSVASVATHAVHAESTPSQSQAHSTAMAVDEISVETKEVKAQPPAPVEGQTNVGVEPIPPSTSAKNNIRDATTNSGGFYIHVANFVRPFTNKQLQDKLNEHGPMIKDSFWMDTIKSQCYAAYATYEIADRNVQALNNNKWPENGRILVARHASKEEKDDVATKKIPPKFDVHSHTAAKGKAANPSPPSAVLEQQSKNKKAEPVRAVPAEKPKPAVSLDELFNKTQTQPPIYWLPKSGNKN